MKHFKRDVPEAIQTKLAALANLSENEWENTLVTGHKGFGGLTDTRTDEIQGNHVSGWIPRQDGGFTVSKLYSCDVDSSYHFTQKQTDFVNKQSANCFEAFLSDNNIDNETQWDGLTEKQKEEFADYENEWFNDGALLQFQMFVEGFNSSDMFAKHKQVTIRLSINYKDAPYFRERGAEDIKQVVFEIDEFLSMENMDIIKQFTV